uniref:Uncharacterized protein n=1 Tax=Acrobeloides nanus TaxID=290746 RepID=A0A914CH74_9BILA
MQKNSKNSFKTPAVAKTPKAIPKRVRFSDNVLENPAGHKKNIGTQLRESYQVVNALEPKVSESYEEASLIQAKVLDILQQIHALLTSRFELEQSKNFIFKKVNQLNELQKEYLEKENAKLDLIEQARSRCLELFGQLED